MGPRPRGVGTPSPGPGPGASARWRGEREAGWGASSGDNSARECACREGAPRARPPGARAGRGRDCGRKSQELSPGAPVPTRAAWREPGREGPEEGVGTGKGTPRSGPCRRGSPGLAGGEAGALAGAHSRALSAAPGIAAPGRGRGAASPARSRAPPPRSSGHGLWDRSPRLWGDPGARAGPAPAADGARARPPPIWTPAWARPGRPSGRGCPGFPRPSLPAPPLPLDLRPPGSRDAPPRLDVAGKSRFLSPHCPRGRLLPLAGPSDRQGGTKRIPTSSWGN